MVMVPYFMIKSFLILVSFSIFAFSSQQIILVVAQDFNLPKAKLQYFALNNYQSDYKLSNKHTITSDLA